MPSGKNPQWEVRVYGTQRGEIDLDLVAHIVVMLGRQLSEETSTENIGASNEPQELDSNEEHIRRRL
jgi:hypothetical protein